MQTEMDLRERAGDALDSAMRKLIRASDRLANANADVLDAVVSVRSALLDALELPDSWLPEHAPGLRQVRRDS